MAPGKSNSNAVWGGSVLLALMFLAAGGMKLLGPQTDFDLGDQYVQSGYPEWLYPGIGIVEVVAALLA